MNGRRADATTTYYLIAVVSSLCFSLSFTVNIVYMADRLGLDAFQLVLIGTVLEVTCFLLEIPTGIVADVYSRRLSVIIGVGLIGVGLVLQGGVPAFWAVVLAQIVWGAGSTFTSGATQAWISDEVGPERLTAIFTRTKQLELAAAVAGIVGAGALSLIDVQIPLVCSGAGFLVLALWLIVRMPERHFAPTPAAERATFRQLAVTARAGLALARRRSVVRSLLLLSLFTGLSAEAFDRLWQLQLLQRFTDGTGFAGHRGFGAQPYVWFAGTELVGVLIALACSVLLDRLRPEQLNHAHPNRLLALLFVAQVAGIVGLALSGWLWLALTALWVKGAARVVADPVIAAWMNRNLTPDVRATVLSFQSQAGALGELVGGPPLGLLGRRTSTTVALLGSATLLAPSVILLVRLRPGMVSATPPADPTDLIQQ